MSLVDKTVRSKQSQTPPSEIETRHHLSVGGYDRDSGQYELFAVDSEGRQKVATGLEFPTTAGGGGNSYHTNAPGQDDFVVTPTADSTIVVISAIGFSIDALNVMGGKYVEVWRTADNSIEDVPLTSIKVTDNGDGTFDVDFADLGTNFATGDKVLLRLLGPDKNRDSTLDSEKVVRIDADRLDQTDPDPVIDADDLVDGTTRYEFDFQGYKHASFHIFMNAATKTAHHNKLVLTMWATNNKDADISADTSWVDVSTDYLGAANITVDSSVSDPDPKESVHFIKDAAVPLKFMFKVVATVGTPTDENNEISILARKSS